MDVLGTTEPNPTMFTMAEQQQQQRQPHAESVELPSTEKTTTTTGPTLIPDNEASRSAVAAPSDQSLRVPCYCEENVWRLACRKIHQCDTSASSSSFFAVFISSKTKVVPMFYQRASRDPYNEACLWDYHVVLLEERRQEYWIHDVDCVLSTNKPIPLQHYLRHCFPVNVTDDYTPLFRYVTTHFDCVLHCIVLYCDVQSNLMTDEYRNGRFNYTSESLLLCVSSMCTFISTSRLTHAHAHTHCLFPYAPNSLSHTHNYMYTV